MITSYDLKSLGLVFMSITAWREARSEPDLGIRAVCWCIRNRAERPKWWGRNVYECCVARWQFSSMTDPNDKQLTLWPRLDDPTYIKCVDISRAVLAGTVPHPFPGADSYYATYIPPPAWATPDKKVGAVGGHVFYNIDTDVPEETFRIVI